MKYKVFVAHSRAIFRKRFFSAIDAINPRLEILQSSSLEVGVKILCNKSPMDFVFIDSNLFIGMYKLFFEKAETLSPNCCIVVFSEANRFLEIQRNHNWSIDGFIPNLSEISQYADEIIFYIGDHERSKSLKLKCSSSKRQIKTGEGLELLSEKHIKISEFLMIGLTNKEISERMYLSEGTVKNYISKIFETIDVSNRTKAAIRLNELYLTF